ncbi:MAG: aromatic ring-hydroxylating dioxygenase subunit alpha [Pseudomonadota bacterium]
MAEVRHEWPNRELEEAFTMPSRYYFDPAIMEDEKHKIFYKSWTMAAHKCELAEPGQFVTVEIFEQSVIVVCGRDEVIRAFHNVCQHRGNRLVTERRGTLRTMVCPYHAWTYGLDGDLRGAPRTERLCNFDKSNYGLKAVRVQEFAGFVYINIDPDAEDMETMFPGASGFLKDLSPDLENLQFESEDDFTAPVNWKVVVDNAIESYHVLLSGPCHKELASFLDYEHDLPIARGNWWTLGGPVKPGLTELFGVEIGNEPYQTDIYMNWWLFPATCVYLVPYVDFVATFLIIPLEAEKTLVRFGYYSPDRPETKITAACRDWMNDGLGPEDIELNITVQQGLKSFGFDQGRFMIDAERSNESEHLVHHFNTKVYEALTSA